METRFTRFKIEIQVRDSDGMGDGRRDKGKGGVFKNFWENKLPGLNLFTVKRKGRVGVTVRFLVGQPGE